MMQVIVPAPLLSLALFATWLLLNGSLSIAHIVLAAALAIAVPWRTERLNLDRSKPAVPRLAAPAVTIRLAAVVLLDIVVSAVQVARRILGPEDRILPGFVWVPLDLVDPHAIVALAGIVTMTPGTLSADLSDDRRYLLVHAFHVGDEAALIASIKRRYEAPLARIFEQREGASL